MPWSIRVAGNKNALAECTPQALLNCKVRTRDHPERWVHKSKRAQDDAAAAAAAAAAAEDRDDEEQMEGREEVAVQE